uniref:E3 ubiquitin-protein ligase SDIR1 n=1 Tax=Noccaea caerulescens TaxID=107243 RepID=A0A1J3J9V4_NOCCA
MDNTDIDMVISIPDTPDRPVRCGSISREVKRRPHSPEAPVRYQREEYRNGCRTRQVPQVGENSDTPTVNVRRFRPSGSNALFRRTTVDKDKGKSICTDGVAASEDMRQVRTASVDCAPLRGDHNSFKMPGNSNKGKGKVDCGSVSERETIDLSSDKKPSRGTKRLVRHGCISPHGIAARARQAAATISKDTVSVEHEIAPETASREIVSEYHIQARARGKRPEISPSRVASRDGLEGWVSTRNRELNTGHELNRRGESDARGICSSVSRLDVQETGAVDREVRQPRRRKIGFTTMRSSNEPDVSITGSSGEPSSSRPSRIQNHQRQGTQVLEIDDSSLEVRVSRVPRRVANDESDVKERQIEADELLARELQEQLYREATVNRNEQIDENIARLLEQEENTLRASSSRSTSTRNTRSTNTAAANPGGRSRLEERLQQNTSSSRRRSNPPQPRASVRAPPRGRGHRLGRATASTHRALNLSFPNYMGVDLRMDLLEGLENLENAIGHAVNNSNLLHMDRDFTEDDYELLLALDENNHRHGGASTHRINNLPESTVQTDNFQETCVICLETPTIGDTIRHLPCFHKFHKDCIDPWLGRSKACPVCKSSVT